MRLSDYLRLGAAGVLAHKRRAILVVVISGLLFSVVMVMFTLLQGFQNAVYAQQYRATGGKVWYRVAFDQEYCEKMVGCANDRGMKAEILELVGKYDGEIIEGVQAYETSAGKMYAVKPELVAGVIEEKYDVPEGAVPIVAAADEVAGWLQLNGGMINSVKARLKMVEEVRERAIGEIVIPRNRYQGPEDEPESDEGKTRFFVEGLLPDPVGNTSLTLGAITGANPLDIIFDAVHLGWGESLILQKGNLEEMLGEPLPMDDEVWVSFANYDKAYGFATEKVNYCAESDRFFGSCGTEYQYRVKSVFGNFVEMEQSLRVQWLVFSVVGLVIGAIAMIIMLTTFARIIGQDKKVIAIYRATGATAAQVRKVYLVYMLLLSVLAAGFALVVGVALALIMNLANLSAIGDAFMLGFGIAKQNIWVIGWNWRMTVLLIGIVVVGPMSVLVNFRKFGSKKLAREMK